MVWRVCNLGNTWKQNMTCTATRRQDWAYHSFVLFDDGHIADPGLDATCPNPHLGWCIEHKKRKKQESIIKSFKRHQGAMTHNDTILDKKVSGSAKLLRVLWASQRGQRLLKDAQKSSSGTGLYRSQHMTRVMLPPILEIVWWCWGQHKVHHRRKW